MPSIGATRARARWEAWLRATTLRLGRHGIALDVDAAGVPTFDAPPAVELSRQLPGTDGPTRVTVTLGRDVHLGHRLVLEVLPGSTSRLALGDGAFVQDGVRVVLLGGDVVLGAAGRLRSGATIRCGGRLEIGERGGLHEHAMVHCANRVTLGAGTLVTERCSVLDSDHTHDGSSTWVMEQPEAVGETVLGDNVLVCANSVVLRDVHLGANSLVAAGSVVRHGIYPPASLLAGVPARVVRSLQGEEAPA